MTPKPVPVSPAERAELQAALRRVYRLTYRQQVRLLNTVRLYVTDFGGEDELDDQLKERADGLAAMRKVAQHLKLPAGTAPNSAQYRVAAAKLGLDDWKVNRFQTVFGRWRFAEDEYEGRRVRETPGQKALRRATTGREREHEDYLAGVEQWLDDIKPAATTMDDYNTYRAAVNPGRVRAGELPLVVAGTVTMQLKLSWSDVLTCARGEVSLDKMLARLAEVDVRKHAGSLALVGMAAIVRLTGEPEGTLRTAVDRGTFPAPVARIGEHTAWHLGDVRAWSAKKTWPHRPQMAWQNRTLDTRSLAERMGRRPDWMWAVMHRYPHRVPPFAGRVGRARYWLLKDVEAFEKKQGADGAEK